MQNYNSKWNRIGVDFRNIKQKTPYLFIIINGLKKSNIIDVGTSLKNDVGYLLNQLETNQYNCFIYFKYIHNCFIYLLYKRTKKQLQQYFSINKREITLVWRWSSLKNLHMPQRAQPDVSHVASNESRNYKVMGHDGKRPTKRKHQSIF